MIRGKPIPETNKSNDEIIEELNNRIAKLSMYGVRRETPTEPGYVLTWSNGGARWYGGGSVVQPGQSVQLDANEFIVPYRKGVIKEVIEQLNPLPLYANSFEGKAKGLQRRN